MQVGGRDDMLREFPRQLGAVPYELSLRILCRKKCGPYSKRRLFGNSSSIILAQFGGGHASFMMMAGGQLITSEDLVVIRDSYSIPSSIILSLLGPHETSRDYRPRHICLNESMLRAGVWIPFEFRVAEALLAFHVSLGYVTPHSWKVIQAMTRFCERVSYWVDRYLWRELLACRLLQGYVVWRLLTILPILRQGGSPV
ncbi:hypothetical protein ACLOJK_006620 [Asimina triloba]